MPAGYSKRSLAEKLGLEADHRACLLRMPQGVEKELGALPASLVRTLPKSGELDFVHAFVDARAKLASELPKLRKRLADDGLLWISWPKKAAAKAAGIETDVTEDVVRELALKNGLVDVKVCAVDETWSGLKLVVPVKDRRR